MKSITLHRGSVLAGIALAAVFTVLAGAAQSPGTAHPIPIKEVRLVGEIPAEWWTYVVLTSSSGTPAETYTVPQGHWFVVTAAAKPFGSGYATYADGQSVVEQLRAVVVEPTNGTRLAFPPGTLLEERMARTDLWGYLEPVR